jgi:hypothetical protein
VLYVVVYSRELMVSPCWFSGADVVCVRQYKASRWGVFKACRMGCDKREGFSPSRVRTGDLAVNSHTLYQLSYRRSTLDNKLHIQSRPSILHAPHNMTESHHAMRGILRTTPKTTRYNPTKHRHTATTSVPLHSSMKRHCGVA